MLLFIGFSRIGHFGYLRFDAIYDLISCIVHYRKKMQTWGYYYSDFNLVKVLLDCFLKSQVALKTAASHLAPTFTLTHIRPRFIFTQSQSEFL
jgi:hypothetical protein